MFFSGCIHREHLFSMLLERIAEENGKQSELCVDKVVRAFLLSLLGNLRRALCIQA